MLSRDDIKNAMQDGHLKIYPFSQENLTGIGYNLTTTNFAFSINNGILLTIHQRTTSNGLEKYVIIPKNDTVLFFSKEYISVDSTIAGTFHSKVARVSQGLGHISTTLDPTWSGQLIISVNNPTSQPIIFDLDKKSGNILTMLLHKLDSKVTGTNIHDNNKGRCDLLLEHFSVPINDKQYRQKHTELKDFVVNQFANSLNGNDDFISQDANDKYDKTVSDLRKLKARLEDDYILIGESRYRLGEKGEYCILRNDNEKQLIRNCTIDIHVMESVSQKFSCVELQNKAQDIQEIIEKLQYVIEFKLQTINHIRRIEWQNEKISYYANEESELVQVRRAKAKKMYRLAFWFPLVGITAFIGAVLAIFLKWGNNIPNQVFPAALTASVSACTAIVTLILQWWYRSWHVLKAKMIE